VTPPAGYLHQSGAFSSVLQQGKGRPRTPQHRQTTPAPPPQRSPRGKGKGGKGRNDQSPNSNPAAGRGGGTGGWKKTYMSAQLKVYAATVDYYLKCPKDNFPLIVNTTNAEFSKLYGTSLFKMTTGKNPSAIIPPKLSDGISWYTLYLPNDAECDASVWAGFRVVGDLIGAFRSDTSTLGLSKLGHVFHRDFASKRTPPLDWARRVSGGHKSLPQRTNNFLAALNASSTALNTAKNSADKVTFDDEDEDEDDEDDGDDDDEEDGLF
jgi:hypothetical protein